ncbi:DNA adenine methylase [Stenoxybacter acetivorans]|uniref:DNA adenine methylase n=1 Tax=Stenoxybacter acetivorans TaxID=422441 RepID=UPI00068C87DA|nr:Dam family site-specific DNA-(adenine-N6)-methyltransferase [Stenoxybacter acetivorans]
MKLSKPFLKWAGGKHKLTPFIHAHLPQRRPRRLIEPFAGSAALSLALDFEAYLLNDTNSDLIQLYKVLKEQKQTFIDYAQSFFSGNLNNETTFYDLRGQFNQEKDAVTKSALFIYLNRHAFNGLCRYNSKGEFNVPFGRYVAPYFPATEMAAFVAKSDRISLMNEDFQAVFTLSGADDVLYCDPPYVPLSKTASFTAYAKTAFGEHQQKTLASRSEELLQQDIPVLISNHDIPFTRRTVH